MDCQICMKCSCKYKACSSYLKHSLNSSEKDNTIVVIKIKRHRLQEFIENLEETYKHHCLSIRNSEEMYVSSKQYIMNK